MKKMLFMRGFLILTALMLIFSSGALSEEEKWICPECETECTGNFCPNCGEKRPLPHTCPFCGYQLEEGKDYNFCPDCGETLKEEETEEEEKRLFSISNLVRNRGTLRIEWQDSWQKAPYKVTFQHEIDQKYTEEQKNLKSWLVEKDVYETSVTSKFFTPGDNYWITVTDADGEKARIHYIPPEEPYFETFPLEIEFQPKMKKDGKIMELGGFAAEALEEEDSPYEFGAYVRLHFPKLSRERVYLVQSVLRTPDGLPFIRTYSEVKFKKGNTSNYWNFMSFEDQFEAIYKQYGFIPTGDYQWELYIRGQFAGSFPVWVGE